MKKFCILLEDHYNPICIEADEVRVYQMTPNGGAVNLFAGDDVVVAQFRKVVGYWPYDSEFVLGESGGAYENYDLWDEEPV